MTKQMLKVLPLLALAGLLAACNQGPNYARSASGAMNVTSAPAAATVLVTVNGEPITTAAVNAYVAIRTRGAHIQLNPMQRRQVVNQLIRINVAYQAAREADLASQPRVQARLALQQKLFLAQQAVQHYMTTASVPQSKLQSEYQKLVAAHSGKRYKARHILVKKKALAEKVIDKLDSGADFAALAKKYSTDKTTASQGGELGWFNPAKMVPPFAKAVSRLQPGHYTEKPVKSRYGWHVILLEDVRTATPPSYTASRPSLVQQAKGTMLKQYLDKLKSRANIEWMVPNPASAAKAARLKRIKAAIERARAKKAAAGSTAAAPALQTAPGTQAPGAATH